MPVEEIWSLNDATVVDLVNDGFRFPKEVDVQQSNPRGIEERAP